MSTLEVMIRFIAYLIVCAVIVSALTVVIYAAAHRKSAANQEEL